MSLRARFIAANQWLSKATEDRLPAVFKRHIQTLYKYEVAELINRRLGQVVLDIGGGKECSFLHYLDAPRWHLIIALDLSEMELRRNRQLQHKIVADAAAKRFPFRDGSADLVVSRSVVEHIRDNAAFFGNCARVLRPGGPMVHAFPGRYAPFALEISSSRTGSRVALSAIFILNGWKRTITASSRFTTAAISRRSGICSLAMASTILALIFCIIKAVTSTFSFRFMSLCSRMI